MNSGPHDAADYGQVLGEYYWVNYKFYYKIIIAKITDNGVNYKYFVLAKLNSDINHSS